jgi:hypothetical protein
MFERMTPTTFEEVAALAAAGQFGVLAIAAAVARRQTGEARLLRQAQSRPYVVVDLRVEDTFIYLEVANVGKTMAEDVRFEFTPALESTMRSDDLHIKHLSLFSEGIPSLAPGKKLETIFDQFPAREGIGRLPDRYVVRVTYESPILKTRQGWRLRPARYTDTMTLDLAVYRNLMHLNRRSLHDVHERLKEISDTLKSMRASGGGLLTRTPRDVKRQFEEFQARRQKQRAPAAAASSIDRAPS